MAKSNQPLYKKSDGGLSVAAWANGIVIQVRKPKDSNNPKGEWYTAETLHVNKPKAKALRIMLKEADAFVEEPKPFKPKAAADDDE